MTKSKSKSQAHPQPQRQYVTRGNRLIPVISSFKVLPGSDSEGSPLILQDPVTKSYYMFVTKAKAHEIINKVLAAEGKLHQNEPSALAQITKEAEDLHKQIEEPEILAVYHKIGKDCGGLKGMTFRFVIR